MNSEKALLFLCSGNTQLNDKKISHKIAMLLQELGIGELGTLDMLSRQHLALAGSRRRMIFINDCKSSCVKLLTHGFDSNEYLYVDVAAHKNSTGFDPTQFIKTEILPAIAAAR